MLNAKWKCILLGVALLIAGKLLYNWGYDDSEVKNQLAFEKHLKEDSANALYAAEHQRKIEQDRELVREAQEKDFNSRLAALSTERDSLANSATGLRTALDSTNAKLRRASEDARLSGINDGSTKAAMVLSELLDQATGELQRVAGTADEWYLNASQCQSFYEEIRSQ